MGRLDERRPKLTSVSFEGTGKTFARVRTRLHRYFVYTERETNNSTSGPYSG